MVKILGDRDQTVEKIAAALEIYEQTHAEATTVVYRYNPAAIRIQIVDQTFHGWSRGERHDYAWQYLQRLPEDTLEQISILLCLAPGESGPLDIEFREPIRSYP